MRYFKSIYLLSLAALIVLHFNSTARSEGLLVEQWLTLGSFKCDTIDQALDIQFLNNEPHIFPDSGEYEAGAGRSWEVKDVNSSGIINFLKLNFVYPTYCVVYAVSYIYSSTERNLNILVGSDDGIAMWINGNQVLHNIQYRGVTRADDLVPVRLSPGWNRLLAKVFNAAGEFGLIAEFVEADNSLPTDLKYSPYKPDRFKPKGINPFPFISSSKLGRSYIPEKSDQRQFPVEVTVRNLGAEKEIDCDVLLSWGKSQTASTKFRMTQMASTSMLLNSDHISEAMNTGITITSKINGNIYDTKILRITPAEVFESVFSSEQLPPETTKLRSMAENISENLYWYEYFTGEKFHQKDKLLLEGSRAILSQDWDAFLRINEKHSKDLNDFSREIKKDTLHLIGQSHIDMAWKWRWEETIDLCRRTYQSALNFFDEVPEYKYIQSQAVSFTWMEEYHPELFKALQQKVKEGRFFLVGGMWVEPDLNVPNGESLVRQFLYGKRYFKEKFGVDCVVGYTPDTFGYTWTLPQILSKAGFKYFVTTKIWWNDTTEFPHYIFWWGSPDGSKILTCLPINLNVSLDLVENAQSMVKYKKQGITDLPLLYGIGDHGGGPTRAHFAKAKKMETLAAYPATHHTDLRSYMELIHSKYKDIPEWNDELYLEYHRGTMTTQGLIKKRNRQSEIWMEEGEKFAVFSEMEYPKAELEDAWKKALFNQFHDILPGSSIPEVFVDANKMYDDVEESIQNIINRGTRTIAERVNTSGNGLPVVVFNPLSWDRTDLVRVSLPENMTVSKVLDEKLTSYAFQQQDNEIVFAAGNVPQSGYKTFWMRDGKNISGKSDLNVSETILENNFFKVEINPQNGNIGRMFDKINKRDVFAENTEGNVLQFFEDLPDKHDAWNIGYTGKQWEAEEVASIEVIETGPVRGIVRYTRLFQNSKFVQDYIVYHDIPRLDIRTEADWQEHHVMLKALFPVNVQSDMATYEIAYGTIQRTTKPNTEAEKAKWEVSAHKFVDISELDFGVSLLNDCKYGHDIVGDSMRITLLRSPVTPDPVTRPKDYVNPYADMGHHEFVYSIYPHSGDHKEGQTHRSAYELNYPLIAVASSRHNGDLPPEHSFIVLKPENLILSVVKKAEDSQNRIARIYEIHGQMANARLRFDSPVKNAWETNLLEERIKPLTVHKNTVELTVQPFEICTIEIE